MSHQYEVSDPRELGGLTGLVADVISELGAGVGSGAYGFTPRDQAAVLTALIADAYQRGVARTDLYQLFNYTDASSGDPWSNNGLFSTTGQPTQAATAIHNLTAAVKQRLRARAEASRRDGVVERLLADRRADLDVEDQARSDRRAR